DPTQVATLFREWNFDLILLDIRMPKMDGFEVMAKLAELVADDYLPILVLTAQTDSETRMRALREGAKDFLNKPLDQEEVLNRIRNMLEVRGLYNERGRQAEILEAKVRMRTVELEETRLQIIHRLGRATEYRDNETGMHIIRISKGCRLLALAAGLDEGRAEMILQASPMHDVGKIGIPDSILLKPGRLDAQEWEIMRRHPEIGAEIIGQHDSKSMRMARSIALSHHEKWDGSGYPKGLAGGDIPIEGRICALADVFDALTSERPYKKAWPIEQARAYVVDNAGVHFDSELVPVFSRVLPDILAIRDEFHD
ncbi:MAG: response regulator, partial [Alphaproteobacteria bacterium]|nr:response regulator [Alphaproteobacteria bacterium]